MVQNSKDLEKSKGASGITEGTQRLTRFDEILNRIIDDAIRGISGETTDDIYYYMKSHGININNVGENPAAFEKAMTEIFKVGWDVFRKTILRSLCRQLNISRDKFADHSFVECVEIAREAFANYVSSGESKRTINEVQSSESESSESTLQLSLSRIESGKTHKTCKVCDKAIDSANTAKDRLIADLCNHCWEVQNGVWEFFLPVANISTRAEHKGGGFGF